MFTDDEMVVLGLNSARSLTFGRGRLNERQVGTAVERLRSAPPHATRIIVTHHPFDLPERYGDDHLVGRASMAMEHLAAAGADLFLAGHLHVTHIGHTAERYKIAGHSALVVQAGTMSTRQRGEPNSFNVLRISRPHLTVARQTWDTAAETFVESAPRRFVHTGQGWEEK
jgi:3',5'-cyclic AMP phosphodiesterase CpdA